MTSISLNLRDQPGQFYPQGLASLAKSIIFSSLSMVDFSRNEYIPAVITGYYSLLHLTISMMYFCPQFVEEKQMIKLIKCIDINDQKNDPTATISHTSAWNYLVCCSRENGLPGIVSLTFDRGKKLREYINYAPRITTDGVNPIFASCEYGVSDFKSFIGKIDEIIQLGIKWSLANPPSPDTYWCKIALKNVDDFLDRPDLGYHQWLSPECMVIAKNSYKNLQGLISDSLT